MAYRSFFRQVSGRALRRAATALLISLGVLTALPAAASAQRAQGTPGTRGHQAPGADRANRPTTPAERAALESQLEKRLADMVQRELSLTDEQMRRVAEVNKRIDVDRRAVLMRDRRARGALRAELEDSGTPNDAKVSALLDEMLAVQQERVRLTTVEQRALSAFLTPVQRARYLGLQEGFRRRMEERRSQGGAAAKRPGAGD